MAPSASGGEPAANPDPADAAPPTSIFGMLVDGLGSVGSIIIGAMMILVCADVVLRNLIDRPITGVAELVALSIIAVLFLQLPCALRHGRLSRAEIFIDSFRLRHPRAGAGLQAVFHVCGALFCGIVGHATLPTFRKAWTEGDFIGVQGVFTAPTWPILLMVLVGATVCVVQFLLLAGGDLREALSPKENAE